MHIFLGIFRSEEFFNLQTSQSSASTINILQSQEYVLEEHEPCLENQDNPSPVVEEDGSLETTLKETLAKLSDLISQRLSADPNGYQNALNLMQKSIKKLPKKKDSAIQQALIDFGRAQTVSLSFFKRKKRQGKTGIPVSVAGVTRRQFTSIGRKRTIQGRHKKTVNKNRKNTNQNVSELPKKKNQKRKNTHSLMARVAQNKGPPAKKRRV